MYNIIYETSHQSRFNARYWMLGAGALGRPRGRVWGGRREEGSGWGTHVYLWQIHFDIWQNLYNIVHGRAYEILDEGLALFGEKITLFHIKDYTVDGDRLLQCGVGKGILDYKRIIAKIFRHNPNATLVLEGTVGEDIAYAVGYIRKIISETENTLA